MTASLAAFLVMGLAVRWNNKGEVVSMAGSLFDYFGDLARGRSELFAEPFVYLALWSMAATAIGWLLQGVVVVFLSRYEKSRPRA